ncbi:hypothetical protein [Erwinia piriflorinigrans]|uniref:Conserved uncharacterized protein n=1 Tax=Erwinia piriflorinigrans CFBP 5888 TaxID=1161919 RepID=V5Z4X6_9GAMM|nr:hypothetical protein [Erwinia piriflorinigrans]CCG86003.1 conserved uncharacterized protein [Erwinia piriflorinigrans CFBP 5888]
MQGRYADDFFRAASFTKELGCDCLDMVVSDNYFLGIEENRTKVINEVIGRYTKKYGFPTLDGFLAQCVRASFHLRPIFSDVIGKECALTFGYIKIDESHYYKQDLDFYRNKLKNNVSGMVNIHAWLTLPSMEVVDFTICTTRLVALLKEQNLSPSDYNDKLTSSKDFGNVVAGDGNNPVGTGLSYYPQVIGDDYAFKSGLIKIS